jgi:hypothetical protein
MMFPPPKQKPEKSPLRPATIVEVLEAGYRYKVFYGGGYHELLTQPAVDSANNPTVGDLVMARNVYNSSQLFLPASSQGGKRCAIYAADNNSEPTVMVARPFTATSPIWTEIKGGLPAATWSAEYTTRMRIAASTPNTAFLLFDETGNTAFSLYKHTNLFGASPGNWSSVYDEAQFLTDIGYGAATISYISASMDICEAQPNDVALFITCQFVSAGTTYYTHVFVHSHDGGSTWQSPIDILSPWSGGGLPGSPATALSQTLAYGRTDQNRIYLAAEWYDTDDTRYEFGHSHDGGHTWSWPITSASGYMVGGENWVLIPTLNNADDDKVIVAEGYQVNSDVFYSSDGGHTLSQRNDMYDDITEVMSIWVAIDEEDYLFAAENSLSGMQRSADGSQTAWTHEGAPSSATIYNVGMRRQDEMALAGLNSGGAATVVYYGQTGSWANKSGDIDAKMSASPVSNIYEVILL